MTIARITIILSFARVLLDPPELPLPCWYPFDLQNDKLFYWIALCISNDCSISNFKRQCNIGFIFSFLDVNDMQAYGNPW